MHTRSKTLKSVIVSGVLIGSLACQNGNKVNPWPQGDTLPHEQNNNNFLGDFDNSNKQNTNTNCPERTNVNYSCVSDQPNTCPEGFCLWNQCLAPIVDADRWIACENQKCDLCETAQNCPTDCASMPVMSGQKIYHNNTTMTFKLHGWSKVSEDDLKNMVYGQYDSLGDIGDAILKYSPGLSSFEDAPTAPNHIAGIEYFGRIPADFYSPADITEIEKYDYNTHEALHRYALITAKAIRYYMEKNGATHANLFCHSMGCHVTRYMIENDIEGLASSNKIVRWTTVAGVIAGSQLSRLFDNPSVQDMAELLGINTYDFIHMNPDYVMDHSASWDHKLFVANNPLFKGLLLHHIVATNPDLASYGLGLSILDSNNPDEDPNDGIMFSMDEYFHDQKLSMQFLTPSQQRLAPTRSYLYQNHLAIRESENAGAQVAAALFHSRKVILSLKSLTIYDDKEKDSLLDFSEEGTPPAEIVVESELRFNPYLVEQFQSDIVAHAQALEDRSLPIYYIDENETLRLNHTIYAGPIFDKMQALWLKIKILEVDYYPRFQIGESFLDKHKGLLEQSLEVPLINDQIVLSNSDASAVLEVKIINLHE